MLKRRYRLKSPALFRRTLNAVKLCANKCFVAYGLQPAEGKPAPASTRFGFIVSTKVHKRATRRNKIKRWFREIIRKDVLTAGALPYQSVVVIARQGMLESEYGNVRRLLTGCLHAESSKGKTS